MMEHDVQAERLKIAFETLISRRMTQLGIKRAALAKKLGKPTQYVTNVLNGDINMTFSIACELGLALGVRLYPIGVCIETGEIMSILEGTDQ